MSATEERIVYRVWFPLEDRPEKSVTMEVSAHPLMGLHTVKHQVWLMLSRHGHDVDPTKGGIDAVGTEEVEV